MSDEGSYLETKKFVTLLQNERETIKLPIGDSKMRSTSQYNEFKVLTKRSFLKSKRDMTLTYLRIIVNIATGLLYGTLYWQTGWHGGKVIYNYSLLFCILIHHMMSTMLLTILKFPSERNILIKECFNKWYSLKMYFISTTIVDIPILVLCCLLFTFIVYLMTGQPLELNRILMFTTISILLVLVVQSYGLVIGSSFNEVNGTFMGFSLSIPIMLLAGFGKGLKGLPVNIYWVSYLSYMKYGFEGALGAIYGWDRPAIYCPDDEYCHYKYPKKFLKDRMLRGDHFWVDVLGLCLMFFIFRVIAYIILNVKLRNAR